MSDEELRPGQIRCSYCESAVFPVRNKKPGLVFWLAILLVPFTCGISLFMLMMDSAFEVTTKCPRCGMILNQTHVKKSASKF